MPKDTKEETKPLREEIDEIVAEREAEKAEPEVSYPPCVWCGGELAPVESGRYLFCRECRATANFRELKKVKK